VIAMAQRTRLLECPGCSKQLEDTKQDNITCKYCGTVFVREDVVQEDEDYIRRKMIVELRTNMEISKKWKLMSTIFMIISFVLVIPTLFIIGIETIHFILGGLFFIGGIVFFGLMITFDRRYESNRSKASDISMRRRL
jgi:DNA-directed RNA polymerase subunit RPC12/RpoP